jgi:hypothetical protein
MYNKIPQIRLQSVNMPMMDIRPMDVCVRYRLMLMEMVMLSIRFTIIVFVKMVFIMIVGMGVSNRFMSVKVPMHFPAEKQHTGKHQRSCHPVCSRGLFTQNNNGKDCAKERSRRKPGAGSCSPNLPQCMNEQDETSSVTERSYNEGSRNLR